MKGFGNIMKEAQKLQAQMEAMQAEAAKKLVDATAGGGMVTVVANGKQESRLVQIGLKGDSFTVVTSGLSVGEQVVLATATTGGNGKQEIVSIKIDREVINHEDGQMLEDLVLAACNEALRKSRDMMQAELGKLTGGLKIPGLGM